MSNQQNTNETVTVDALSAQAREELKDAIHEISDSLTRISAEQDLIKDTLQQVYDTLGVNKSLIKKLAVAYNKNTFLDQKDKQETFEEFYEAIFENK